MARETDRPLAQIAQAALYYWATGDHVGEDLDGDDEAWKIDEALENGDADGVLAGYWSDEDKEAVEELARDLAPMIEAALRAAGWKES